MPRSYVHLSLEDRRKIARWHDAKMPVLEIAHRLGRHRATIHRELKRNRFVDSELRDLSGYYALNAQTKAEGRRAGLRKLIRHRDLCDVVVDRLKTGWTTCSHAWLEGWATAGRRREKVPTLNRQPAARRILRLLACSISVALMLHRSGARSQVQDVS